MLTTQEIALIAELEDAGFVYCESFEEEQEDGSILVTLLVPVEEDGAATAAAKADAGE